MKVLKLAFVLVVVGLASAAFASSPQSDDGREEALGFCENFTFNSYIEQCADVVRQARYFDVRAVNLCGTMSADTRKMQCVQMIANKTYLDGEIAICGKEEFESNRLDCLVRGGEGYIPANGCTIDVRSVENRLMSGLTSLRNGDPATADQTIVDVLNYLSEREPPRP